MRLTLRLFIIMFFIGLVGCATASKNEKGNSAQVKNIPQVASYLAKANYKCMVCLRVFDGKVVNCPYDGSPLQKR